MFQKPNNVNVSYQIRTRHSWLNAYTTATIHVGIRDNCMKDYKTKMSRYIRYILERGFIALKRAFI